MCVHAVCALENKGEEGEARERDAGWSFEISVFFVASCWQAGWWCSVGAGGWGLMGGGEYTVSGGKEGKVRCEE